MDAVYRGELEFAENAMNFANGMPKFAQKTVNGVAVSVCENAQQPDEVLAVCDDGTPLVCVYRKGKGEVVLFNTSAYPAHPAITALYERELVKLAEWANAAEPVWASCGDDVEFTVYRQADGGAHVYFLAMDWYREPGFLRRATLRVGADHYNVDVPFGVMLKCVCNGKSAVWAKSEDGEVLSLGENAATVQGAGIVTFCVAKNGTVTEKTVDFTVAPVAEIALD
jgi:hypothetical protein